MEEEIWKDISGYEGYYQVSNLGRVKSVQRVIYRRYEDGRNVRKTIKERIVKPYEHDRFGHLVVNLWRNNKLKHELLHRLVAQEFIGGEHEGLVVRHLDGNPRNNRVENLAYGTTTDNIMDCYKYRGRWKNTTEDQARKIKELLRDTDMKHRDIAKIVEVPISVVHRISGGYSFKWLTID